MAEPGSNGAHANTPNGLTTGHGHQPRLLYATILFVDLMGSVAISNHLTVWEYNSLLNDYQDMLREVLEASPPSLPITEHYIGGDQLALFIYQQDDADELAELERLRGQGAPEAEWKHIEQAIEERQQRYVLGAMRCAVSIKNAWIGHWRNIARVNAQQPVLDVGVGINSGQVVLQRRGDGRERIEGYAINFAKRVEGYARHGRYCKVMLSKRAFETFRQTVFRHLMMKQRAAFATFEPQPGMLKGLAPGTQVFELKYFHRLTGFGIQAEEVPHFTQIFHEDPTNVWAYTNLVNYHLYESRDFATAREVAIRALSSSTQNEKVYYDLATISFNSKDYSAASEYCQRCIQLNSEMDIAYDLQADVVEQSGGSWEDVLRWRTRALAIAPRSAGYNIEVARALAYLGRKTEARIRRSEAYGIFPEMPAAFPEVHAEIAGLLGESVEAAASPA